jgi:GNAT superfamily N-acetyltransferase/DNA-binding MarR family transcriptional regulator
MDIIKSLGELAFASRLKRLSERLMKDASRIYRALEMNFEARWFPVLYALSKQSPMAVTELAQALGLTHTAVNQLASEMMKKKLLLSTRDKTDERKRLLQLSKKGQRAASELGPVWREIKRSTRELIVSSGHDLLSALGKIEELLDEQDMYERVCARMGIAPGEEVEIVDYRPAYKKHFKSLNYEWLNEHFSVEEHDEVLLDDPNGRIIRRGGAVLFAKVGEEIVGTCALVRHSDEVFELTKMAVIARARRQKIGTKLAEAVIQRARARKANTIYLETSPKLLPALHLYEKLGFKKTGRGPLGRLRYKRRTRTLKLDL